MKSPIFEHFDEALQIFTSEDYYQTLLLARDEYFNLTGQLNDDDDDYETRMSSFNEWYLMQFIPKHNTRVLMKEYLLGNKINGEIVHSFLNSTFSIFEYRGISWRKNIILQDIVNGKKMIMSKNYLMPGMLKHDIFLGRHICFDGESLILPGISMLPKEVKLIVLKKAKQVLRFNDPTAVSRFLVNVEKLKNRWHRYGHLEVTKLFIFDDE